MVPMMIKSGIMRRGLVPALNAFSKTCLSMVAMLLVPPEISSNVLVEARIERFEVLYQALSRGRFHGSVPGLIKGLVFLLLLYYWYVEKLQCLFDYQRRFSIEIFAFENQ